MRVKAGPTMRGVWPHRATTSSSGDEDRRDWLAQFHPTAGSDEELLDYIRGIGQTSYHPVGSCRMGVDDASVVDPWLRVRGLEALRVADASIFPTMPSANTNAPAMMVGERAARFMLEAAQAR